MNREQLKRLMKKHSWSMEDVATISEASIHSVRAWLRPSTSFASRNMRPQATERIEAAAEKLSRPATRKTALIAGRKEAV